MRKKYLFILFILLLSSCTKKEKPTIHDLWVSSIRFYDEYNSYNDNIYLKATKGESKKILNYFVLDKKTDEKLYEESLENYNNIDYCIRIYDDYIYELFNDDSKCDLLFKITKLGDLSSSYSINIDKTCKIIEVNNNMFYIDTYFNFEKMGYNLFQCIPVRYFVNEFYASLDDKTKIYKIYLENENIVIENFYNYNKKCRYSYSKQLIEADYYEKSNAQFHDILDFYLEEKDSYSLDLHTIKLLEDDNVYFSYSRYLGEFKYSDCPYYKECIFSNRISQILRFNPFLNKIEKVVTIPEGYTVLSIYLNKAIIMKDNEISTYNFENEEIYGSKIIDCSNLYESNNLKFYFNNHLFDKVINETEYNYGITYINSNFDCLKT